MYLNTRLLDMDARGSWLFYVAYTLLIVGSFVSSLAVGFYRHQRCIRFGRRLGFAEVVFRSREPCCHPDNSIRDSSVVRLFFSWHATQ